MLLHLGHQSGHAFGGHCAEGGQVGRSTLDELHEVSPEEVETEKGNDVVEG